MLNQLPPDISERLQAWVVAGGYRSEEEALREALDALDERDWEKLGGGTREMPWP